jgi:DNA invertase Pin-like site-specific DNA recombinase
MEADKKRKQTGGDFKVGDGEYHTRKKEPKYTEEIWNEGKKMHNLGIPYREIAARQGFSENYVAKVLRLPSYDALVNIRKEEQAKRKAEFERTKAMVEAEMESLDTQLDEVAVSEPKQEELYEPKKKSELPEPVVQERVEMPYTGRRADTHRPTKVTKRVFDNIKERYLNGETTRQLADDTKLGRGTINRIAQANNIDEYFSKRAADRAKYRKTKKTEISPELIELRAMNDYLARIAEALEKIASQPKKRGLFRK